MSPTLFGQTTSPATDINGGWRRFYDNVKMPPTAPASVFIRSPGASPNARQTAAALASGRSGAPTLCGINDFLAAVDAGRIQNYTDARACKK